MQEPSALGRIVELVRDLRRRCPWDAAQTPQTLRPYFVEEAMELDRAMGHDDPAEIRAELGDVLLHVAFQIVLAEERGAFGAEDLTRAVEEKMWRRHPHLFPSARPSPPPDGGGGEGGGYPARRDAAAHNVHWERTKARERAKGGSVLDGIPPNMPALVEAYRLQEKAAGVGFDWPDVGGPLEKVREETEEVTSELGGAAEAAEAAGAAGRVSDEIGDLLFAVVNLSRKAGVDPRAALEQANRRFADRFRKLEQLAAARDIDIHTAGLEALDGLWEEVKQED